MRQVRLAIGRAGLGRTGFTAVLTAYQPFPQEKDSGCTGCDEYGKANAVFPLVA